MIHRSVPLRIFSALRDKNFSTENIDIPPPPLIHKLFRYQKISGKQKGSFTKLFVSVLWDKKILTKPWWPSPSYAWKFSIKEFFWNTKMFANEIFGYTETENRDTTPLIHKIFFPTRNFLKQNGSLARFFRSCAIKKVFDKTVKLPPCFAWNFSIPEIFRNTEGFSYDFYRQWDKDFSAEFSDIPIFCIKICDARNFLNHLSVP